MPGTIPTVRTHAAVQQIINRLKRHGNRVLVNSVSICGSHARGLLPVTITHLPDLRGHFPGNPVVPAVVMLEAMFQVAAVLADERGTAPRLDCIREAKFRRIVTPRDRELLITVLDDPAGFRGTATAGRNVVAEAVFGE